MRLTQSHEMIFVPTPSSERRELMLFNELENITKLEIGDMAEEESELHILLPTSVTRILSFCSTETEGRTACLPQTVILNMS